MKELQKLLDRIVQRININLRELDYDVSPFIQNLVALNKMVEFYAFYGITPHHPPSFEFRHSSLAGSYFLGKIRTANSILYKSDIRGDELKHRGIYFVIKSLKSRSAGTRASTSKTVCLSKPWSTIIPMTRNL